MRISKKSAAFVDFLKQRAPKGQALVVMHDNPDPDSLASGMLLKNIFERAYGMTVVMAYNGIIGRAENRQMVQELGLSLVRTRRLKLDDYAIVATVDTQPGAGNNLLDSADRVDIVIDHHPRLPGLRGVPWTDIRTRHGASTTIALEYLTAHKLDLTKTEATACIYALKSETQDLGREAVPADRRAYFHLFTKADYEMLFRISRAQVGREYFRSLSRGLENSRIYNDVLITNLDTIDIPDYVPEIADMLLRLKEVVWTFVVGRYQDNLYLSIRTLDTRANAGDVMKQVVAGLGSGGGHDLMAGGRVENLEAGVDPKVVIEELMQRCLKALRKRSSGSDLIATATEKRE